ncbi:MAG TPA: rhodanese-like domain-containing protein [Bacteroidetes bacterium]|nr:rhodanese-like domain-containing protein [Bacteroidota bacterium]
METTDKPKLQEFHIDGVKHISSEIAFVEIAEKRAILVDVREIHEVKMESVPFDHVLYHPLSVIMDRLPFIPQEQNIILGCLAGVRSTKVANLLNRQGFPHVANLDGGFRVWKEKGYPYKSLIENYVQGGCGCDKNCCSTSA